AFGTTRPGVVETPGALIPLLALRAPRGARSASKGISAPDLVGQTLLLLEVLVHPIELPQLGILIEVRELLFPMFGFFRRRRRLLRPARRSQRLVPLFVDPVHIVVTRPHDTTAPPRRILNTVIARHDGEPFRLRVAIDEFFN